MSVPDFRFLTPDEFNQIVKYHVRANETMFQNEWERARFISLYSLAPYSKKALKPSDVCMFDWEKNKPVKTDLSNEEKEYSRKRIKELGERWGNRIG